MDNNVYMSEEEFQRVNKKIKKIGVMLIIIGIVLLVAGIIIVLLPNQFGAIGIILGSISCFVGLVLKFFIGNQREINAYFAQQSMPIVKESMEKMAPSAGVSAKEIAKGIKEGISEEEK